MILARLQPRESTERRAAPRRQLKLGLAGSTQSVGDVEVVVHDLSATGLLIEATADLQTGDRLEVDIPGAGGAEAVVVWRSGHYFGCEFPRPIPKAALSAASLRSAPRPQPEEPAGPLSLPLSQPTARPVVEFGYAPAHHGSGLEGPRSSDALSPKRKLLVLLGLSLAGWAVIALVVWLVLALVWG